jgi:membrane protein DedA with SNARE-associated domain
MTAALYDSFAALVELSPYLGILALLILGIWVLPLAEETALAMAGYLYYSGHSPLVVVLPLTIAGVFLGDALAFWLRRRWSTAARRFVLPLVVGRRRSCATLTRLLDTYSSCVIVGARFLPGVRLPVHVLAGLSGMPVFRYLPLSFFAVGLYVPALIVLAAAYGDHLDHALSALERVSTATWHAGLMLLGLWLVVRLRGVWRLRLNRCGRHL